MVGITLEVSATECFLGGGLFAGCQRRFLCWVSTFWGFYRGVSVGFLWGFCLLCVLDWISTGGFFAGFLRVTIERVMNSAIDL